MNARNHRLALAIFIGTEVMLFAGLISSFLVLEGGLPPGGAPLLPLPVTALNTGVLLASGVSVFLALGAIRRDAQAAFRSWLGLTQLLGLVFLLVQGTEWTALVRDGLTLRSGSYGGIFYLLVGLHALHVLGALLWLAEVYRRARGGCYGASAHLGPELASLYWGFVVLLWPALFALLYRPFRA